ncbi:MAG: excinuclease ABC subunit UvrC [Desulfitobacteriaceae bacterium]
MHPRPKPTRIKNKRGEHNMEILRQKLSLLPEKPGVYLMKNTDGHIIYVGKAKVLKNRVRSYFTGSHDGKTQKLVSLITDFEYIITESEAEALVLECNLIKKHNPKYNILLRDDKTYPYLMITNEKHPRMLVTRKIDQKKGKYFGPYPSAGSAREAARLLNRLFPLRKCRQLPARHCLYYHLGQCLGPCVQEVSAPKYEKILKDVNYFLRGGQERVIRWLEAKMFKASDELQFERAMEYRDLIEDLKRLGEKQNITLTDFVDRDVVGYAVLEDQMCIHIFYLRQGKLLARDSFIFPYYEEAEEAFISFLAQFYTENTVWPKEILIPELTNSLLQELFPVTVPRKGKKRELVQLTIENAQTALEEEKALAGLAHKKAEQALGALGQSLNVPAPAVIEAFDISNTAGTHPVAGMVQFLHGQPCRSGYRKFKIQEMAQRDDTAAMNQTIGRRYARLASEGMPLPDLILVDGGKGQISAAREALSTLKLDIPVAGMVKDDRHRTAGLLDAQGRLLTLDESAFHLLARIQEEVHRFSVTFHRQQRAKNMVLSQLDGIPGIGTRRRQLLLRSFQSMDNIRAASVAELNGAGLPLNAAQAVFDHFHRSERNDS